MKISILKPAEKFLEKLPHSQKERLLLSIFDLPKGDVKRLQGKDEFFRLRVGGFRVIYVIQNDMITVRDIGNRGDVYK